ncbi:hypothetical protein [Streptomyces tritici]|uniref:hypothetical protein n=1 Tax=Streptomyces tritici TaxID=2054410 RepID=UPI003AF038E4
MLRTNPSVSSPGTRPSRRPRLGRRLACALAGGPGDDFLNGDSGRDTLDGGSGANTNNGGAGNDLCTNPSAGSSCNP